MAKQPRKTESEVGAERVKIAIRSRFNPIRGLTPEILAQQLDEFESGYLKRFALTMNTVEDRDDILKSVAPKRKKATSRNPYEIIMEDDSPQAERHKKVLEAFYRNIQVTSAADLNQRGGFPLLVRQMMDAVGKRYAVHEIIWKPEASGLTAEFRFVPLWFFENSTGKLRFLASDASLNGSDLAEGEWMVTVGDGVMIACCVAYMFKTLPMKDWLIYCDRSGNPGIRGKTAATRGSAEWKAMVQAVANYATDYAAVMGNDESIEPINIESKGQLPFPGLIERMDRALSCLWRGADLSTLSGGTSQAGQGASLQGEESDILEEDDCQLISETLNEQVDRYVIRYTTGDETPMAYIQIKPRVKKNVDADLKIDEFLVRNGARLSIAGSLQRYGRQAADDDEEVLAAPAGAQATIGTPAPTGVPTSLANEAPDEQAFEAFMAETRLQLPEAQHKALELVAKPFQAAYAKAKAGKFTPEELAKELIRVRDEELPKIIMEMNKEPSTATLLEEAIGTSVVNGIAEAADETEAK
jgi:phage gp29-like protein